MNIQTSHSPASSSIVRPGTFAWKALKDSRDLDTSRPGAPGAAAKPHRQSGGHEGSEPLNEAIVEIPGVLLHLSHLDHRAPALASAAGLGLAGLAGVRAAQCFRVSGWEAKLEGASAMALAASSVASSFHGALAHQVAHGAHGVHGVLELGLGAHQTIEAIEHKAGWKQIADGALGVVKGAATLTSLVFPGLETASNLVELGALVGRVGLEASH